MSGPAGALLEGAASAAAFPELIERWHDFFLMTGTAAVTLVGLLFVSLSIHLDVLLHDRRAHLLDLARQTLLAYVYVLLVSLMFLVPPTSPRSLGFNVGAATAVVLGIALVGLVREMWQRETAIERRALARRRLLQIVALGLALYAAWQIGIGEPLGMSLFYAPLAVLLANATGSAWMLLVQVGRLKARESESRP